MPAAEERTAHLSGAEYDGQPVFLVCYTSDTELIGK
jgi:hypothetical protein